MLLFSTQVLPVRKIGKLLSKAQGTEEVQSDNDDDSDDDDSGCTGFSSVDVFIHPQTFHPVVVYFFPGTTTAVVLHRASDLPATLVAGMPSPPPEC